MLLVYILYSSSLQRYYVGYTDDLNRRLAQHNAGKGNYTSKGIPWIVIHQFECNSKSEAVKLEMKIKKRGIQRYLQDNRLATVSGAEEAR
jgi:putative endonuclease